MIHYFNHDGVVAFEHVPLDILHRVAQLCGARTIYRVDDLKSEDLGDADLTEPFEPLHRSSIIQKNDSCVVSLLLTASTQSLAEELKRACEDTLRNVRVLLKLDTKVLPAGGAVEVELQNHLRKVSSSIESLEQVKYSE